MAAIEVGDFVEIIQGGAAEQHLLHRPARVMAILDGTTCILVFEDGSGATVNIGQLKKI